MSESFSCTTQSTNGPGEDGSSSSSKHPSPQTPKSKATVVEHGVDPHLSFRITFKQIGAGLENLGNTCFLNSVLQCLTYTEPFAAYLQSGEHKSSCKINGFCAMCAIQNHVRCALQSTGEILAPKDFVRNIRRISRNFRYARQEDAHEYMVNLLDSMHRCCLPFGLVSESPSAYEKSLVHKIFGGHLRSQVKCTECSYRSNKYDPFLDLSLEIAGANSLLKALAKFTDVEQLDGGEKQYQCQRCDRKVRAVRQLTIHKVPYVLTIHLKRFGSLVPGQKIDKKLEFGPTLNLKPFVSGTYTSQEEDLKYTLYGVLVHAGWSSHSGHYYCYVRTTGGRWYELDDNEVFEVGERTVFEQKAYMLFYVRNRKILAPKKPVHALEGNLVVNDAKKKECSASSIGCNETVPNMKLAKGSTTPVLSTTSSVAEGGDSVSDLSGAPVAVKTKDTYELEETKANSNHLRTEDLPEVVSSVVKDGVMRPYPTGPNTKAIDEHGRSMTELTVSVATLPDSSGLTSATDMERENVPVSETVSSEKMSTVRKLEIVEDGSMRSSSQSIAQDTLCNTFNDLTVPVATLPDCNNLQECTSKISVTDMEHENASVSNTVPSKELCKISELETGEDVFTRISTQSSARETLCYKSNEPTVPVASLPDFNDLREFTSKTSATDEEQQNALVSEMAPSNELCKIRESETEEKNSIRLSSQSSAKDTLCNKFNDLIVPVTTLPNCNGLHEVTSETSTKGMEHENSSATDMMPTKELCFGIHPVCKKLTDLSVPVATLPDCNFSQEYTSNGLATDVELENASVNAIVPSKELCKISESETEENNSMQSSSQLSSKDAICEKLNDLSVLVATLPDCKDLQESTLRTSATKMEHKKALVSETVPGKELCKASELEPEDDLVRFSSQSSSTDELCKKISDLNATPSAVVQLPTYLGIGEAFCTRVNGLGHNQIESMLSNQSGQKVLKPKKHLMKVACMHLRSSLLSRTILFIHKKRKHKRSRKRCSEYQKELEDSLSGLEASTSGKTRIGNVDSSKSKRKRGDHVNNKHDRTVGEYVMDSFGISATKSVELEFSERIGQSGAVLPSEETSLMRCSSNSTLISTTKRCDRRKSDSSENKCSFHDFMNMLTRGLEETTVARWDMIASHPSKFLGSTNAQNISIGDGADKWDVEYGRGKRKKLRPTKNGLSRQDPLREIATTKSRLKKGKMDQSSSGNRPLRI